MERLRSEPGASCLGGTTSANPLISEIPASRAARNKPLLFIRHRLYSVLLEHSEWTLAALPFPPENCITQLILIFAPGPSVVKRHKLQVIPSEPQCTEDVCSRNTRVFNGWCKGLITSGK